MRQNQSFRRLFWAQAGSQLSVQSLRLILSLIAIQALKASQSQVSLLLAFLTIAFPFIGLPVGAFVDRGNCRAIMIGSDIVRGLALAALPVLWWMGDLSISVLFAVSVTVGVATVFFDLSYRSFLPEIVQRADLTTRNAQLESVRSLSQVGGPSMGGAFAQVASAPLAALMNVGGFLFSAASLMLIRTQRRAVQSPEPRNQRRPRILQEMVEGLKFVFSNRQIRRITVNCSLFNLFVSAQYPVYIYFLTRELKLSGSTIGILMALAGVGGFLGSVIVKKVNLRFGQNTASALSIGTISGLMLLLPLTQPGWRLLVVAAYQVTSGMGTAIYNVNLVSLQQLLTPERMLGRMNASIRVLTWGTVPLGSLLGGELAHVTNTRSALFLCGLGTAIAFAGLVIFPVRNQADSLLLQSSQGNPDEIDSPAIQNPPPRPR